MTRVQRNMTFFIVLIMMAIAIVIINLNTASMRFSRLDNKILESFISSCDRLLETELPKGAKSKEIPAGQAKFAPEILRFNPEIVRLHPDFVWVLFRDRFAVIWEHDQSTQMEWKLTVCVDGAFSRVLLRRPKGKQAGES